MDEPCLCVCVCMEPENSAVWRNRDHGFRLRETAKLLFLFPLPPSQLWLAREAFARIS